MEKNDLSAKTPVAKNVKDTKAYQLIKALKKIRDSVPFNGDKNGLDTLNEAVNYFSAITLLFEAKQEKNAILPPTPITLECAKESRKALLDHPDLQQLIRDGWLTPISIEREALERLLKVSTSTYDAVHSYPVLRKNTQNRIYISQCLVGFAKKKEDFTTMENVFDPWPPTLVNEPLPDTLDAEIARDPTTTCKPVPAV